MNASRHPPPVEPHWLTGQILIAMPGVRDPRFAQAVIFICAHTAEGAMGVLVNRPLKKPRFVELLKQLEIEPAPTAREIRLGTGGPVETNRGFVLHSPDWSTEGSLDVDGTYVLTSSLEILAAMAAGDGPKQGFMALGYAGWGPGQLDDEISANGWLSVGPDEAIVYDSDDGTKWRRALAKLRIDPAMLSGGCGAGVISKIVVATHNTGKLAEFRGLFRGCGAELVSAGDLGLAEPAETGATFAENARLKARAAADVSGLVSVADDSGLCVAALDCGPGVFSARYAAGDYPAAFARIIAAADAGDDRRARFVCALCLAFPGGETATFIGQADGVIAARPAGAAGFGYDAIFVPDGYGQTYAELGGVVKARESHRARAAAQVVAAFGK